MTTINSKIKHVVVVMFENRSFDHMLGFLYNDSYKNKKTNKKNINVSPLGHPYEGLTGKETNPDGKGGSVQVFPIDKNDKYAYYMPKMDPGEGFINTNYQLFGASIPPFPKKIGPNQGFLLDFEGKIGNKYYGDLPKKKTNNSTTDSTVKKTYPKNYDHSKDYKNDDYKKWYKEELPPEASLKIVPKLKGTIPADIMGMHTPDTLPILSNLAKGYAVCDHYYCSVPSETLPNRAFMHLATSQGNLYDEEKRYSAPSIFKNLTNHGHTWGIYGYKAKKEPYTFTFCEDISKKEPVIVNGVKTEEYVIPKGCQCGKFTEFEAALENETLPDYTFLEPSWGSYGNSQHPNYDVAAGEAYMLEIYNKLRASKYWENTLLIINYDEHGGCYDHVTPPTGAAQPSPTTVNKNNGFKFDRFGVRVPCVLISPWIEAGTVYRTQSDVPLDHTSILKTIEVLFNLPTLTARDEAAADMLDVLTRDTPRKDNPLEGIKAPIADSSVKVENHASQILRAQADALTEKRNSETGTQLETPEFKTDEEAHAYINKS